MPTAKERLWLLKMGVGLNKDLTWKKANPLQMQIVVVCTSDVLQQLLSQYIIPLRMFSPPTLVATTVRSWRIMLV